MIRMGVNDDLMPFACIGQVEMVVVMTVVRFRFGRITGGASGFLPQVALAGIGVVGAYLMDCGGFCISPRKGGLGYRHVASLRERHSVSG